MDDEEEDLRERTAEFGVTERDHYVTEKSCDQRARRNTRSNTSKNNNSSPSNKITKQITKKAKLTLNKKSTEKLCRQLNRIAQAVKTDVSLNQSDDFRDQMTCVRPKPPSHAQNKKSQPNKTRKQNVKKKFKCDTESRNTDSESCRSECENNVDENTAKLIGGLGIDKDIVSVDEESAKFCKDYKFNDEIKRSCSVEKTSDVGRRCLSCQQIVPGQEYDSHIIQCMRSAYQFEGRKVVNDGEMAEQLSSREQEKLREERLTDTQYSFCPVCQKDLSHLNSQRRLQHVNRCLDQREAKKKMEAETELVMERARNKVLDCPLCGQPLKTQNARKAHLKRCAAQLHVPIHVMMDRVKQQEEEYQIQLAAGVVPLQRISVPERKSVKTKATRRPKKVKQPDNKFDEDTQLALALSSSVVENQREDDSAETQQKKSEKEELMSAFAMLMTPHANKTSKSKKKNKLQQMPKLLQVTDEMRQKHYAEVIDPLLSLENESTACQPRTPAFKKSRLTVQNSGFTEGDKENRAVCRVVDVYDEEGWTVWRKTSLHDVDHVNRVDMYYVSCLMPPITVDEVRAGSKLKALSAIPGRRKSISVSQSSADCDQNVSGTSAGTEVFLASTQTAVMLAELADNDAHTQLTQTNSCSSLHHTQLTLTNSCSSLRHTQLTQTNSCSTVHPQNECEQSGFYRDDADVDLKDDAEAVRNAEDDHVSVKSAAMTRLLNDLGGLVGSHVQSDVKVICAGGEMIPAHSFMLNLRCPKLMQVHGMGVDIDLSASSKASVMAFLHYLYAADVNISSQVVQEVLNLAERYEVEELSSVCETIVSSNINMMEAEPLSTDVQSVSSHQNRELADLLKEVWGDEDSDDSSEDDEDDRKKREAERDEEEMNELYEYMCTQRQRQKQKKSNAEECQHMVGIETPTKLVPGDGGNPVPMETPTKPVHRESEFVTSVDTPSKAVSDDNAVSMDTPTKNSSRIDDIVHGEVCEADEIENLSQNLLQQLEESFTDHVMYDQQMEDGYTENKTTEHVLEDLKPDQSPENKVNMHVNEVEEVTDESDHIHDDISVHQETDKCARGNLYNGENELDVHVDDDSLLFDNSRDHSKIGHDCESSDNREQTCQSDLNRRKNEDLLETGVHADVSGGEDDFNDSLDIGQLTPNRGSPEECHGNIEKGNSTGQEENMFAYEESSNPLLIPETPYVTKNGKNVFASTKISSQILPSQNTPSHLPKNWTEIKRKESSDDVSNHAFFVNKDAKRIEADANSPVYLGKLSSVVSDSPLFRTKLSSVVSDSTSPDLFGYKQHQKSSTPCVPEVRGHDKVKKDSIGLSPVVRASSESECAGINDRKETQNEVCQKLYKAVDDSADEVMLLDDSSVDSNDKMQSPGASSYCSTLAFSPTFPSKVPDSNYLSPSKEENDPFSDEPDSPVFGTLQSLKDKKETMVEKYLQSQDFSRGSRRIDKYSRANLDSGSANLGNPTSEKLPSFTNDSRKKWTFKSKNGKSAVHCINDKESEVLSSEEGKRKRLLRSTDEECSVTSNKKKKSTDVSECSIGNDLHRNSQTSEVISSKTTAHLISTSHECEEPMPISSKMSDLTHQASPADDSQDKNKLSPSHVDTIDLTLEDEEEKTRSSTQSAGLVASPKSVGVHDGELGESPCYDNGEDVWAGFDDDGFTVDMNTAVPSSQQASQTDSMKDLSPGSVDIDYTVRTEDCNDSVSDCSDRAGFDPPTFIEDSFCDGMGDGSVLNDKESAAALNVKPNSSSNLPQKQVTRIDRPRKTKKAFIPPSPFTPMPEYGAMATPELKKACNRYGVRAMPKKRMVKTLVHVYQQTHQYETDSEFEKSVHVEEGAQADTLCNSPVKTITNVPATTARTADDNSDAEDLENSFDSQSSQSSSHNVLAEETSVLSSPQKPTSKNAEERILKYIKENEAIHLKILHYEPLEFKEFKEAISKAGIRIGTRKLSDFLDDKSIPFTMREKAEPGQKAKPRQRSYKRPKKKA